MNNEERLRMKQVYHLDRKVILLAITDICCASRLQGWLVVQTPPRTMTETTDPSVCSADIFVLHTPAQMFRAAAIEIEIMLTDLLLEVLS
jgi:hypothetical protein